MKYVLISVVISGIFLMPASAHAGGVAPTPLYGPLPMPWAAAVSGVLSRPEFPGALNRYLPGSIDVRALSPSDDVWSIAIAHLPPEYSPERLRDDPESSAIFLVALGDGLRRTQSDIREAVQAAHSPDTDADKLPDILRRLRELERYAPLLNWDASRQIADGIKTVQSRYREVVVEPLLVEVIPEAAVVEPVASVSPRQTEWERLEKDEELAPYFARRTARIVPGSRTYFGGFGLIVVDERRKGRFSKIAFPQTHLQEFPMGKTSVESEARALLRLKQAGIEEGLPRLTGIGINPDGLAWIDLFGIAGAEDLRRSPLWKSFSMVEQLGKMMQFARILGQMHAAGWVHNDITPGNLLINRLGEAMIIDFGFADVIGARSVAGTQHYQPPEEVRGPDSDVYSFGKVLEKVFFNSPWEELQSSGLARLIEGMTIDAPREYRTPSTMSAAHDELGRIQFFYRNLAGFDEEGYPLPSEYEGHGLYPLKEFNFSPSGLKQEVRRTARNIAGDVLRDFDYLKYRPVKFVLQEAIEIAARLALRENGAQVSVRADIKGDDILFQIRIGESFGVSPITLPNRDRIAKALGSVYDPRVKTAKHPFVHWSKNSEGRLAEFRIPLLDEAELAGFDAWKRALW